VVHQTETKPFSEASCFFNCMMDKLKKIIFFSKSYFSVSHRLLVNVTQGKGITNVYSVNLNDWLTMHRSITLVVLQLDAQNSYLFTYNIFIKILCMFRALFRSSSGGLRRYWIYAASGIVTLCRWLSCAPVKKVLS